VSQLALSTEIRVGDCREIAPAMAAEGIHPKLIVTSPPYNAGLEYGAGINDARPWEEYWAWAREWMAACRDVCESGARICIVVADGIGRSPWVPLAGRYMAEAIGLGLLPRGTIIWDKLGNSSTAWGSWCSAANPSLRDQHEVILVFSVGEYGRPSGESVISSDEFLEYTKSVWRIRPETTLPGFARKHPAPFPLEIPRRLLKLYSYPGDVVFDPFCGSGTTLVAAKDLGRSAVGCDISEAFVAISRARLAQGKMEFGGSE